MENNNLQTVFSVCSAKNKEVQMMRRRTFIAAALAAPVVPLGSALAQAVKEPAKQPDFLFVQTAKGMSFDKSTNKLTLEASAPSPYFSPTAPNASPET